MLTRGFSSVKSVTRHSRCFAAGIDASKLQVTRNQNPGKLPPIETLEFGTIFTDHILEVDWTKEGGWEAPVIKPYGPLMLPPSVCGLHYAVQCFEGAKAYKDDEGKLRTFRLDMNMKRMTNSMQRVGLPGLTENDQTELIKLIKELVRIDASWVPQADGYSLYLRPTAIGTHTALGLVQPAKAKWYCIASPVGPYYKTGFKPVQLLASDKYARAFPGGTGAFKVGGNYGATVMPSVECFEDGFSQILWLLEHGKDDFLITEAGTMNFFVYWVTPSGEKELITAPLGELVLPGVTRDTILKICEQDGIKVTERPYLWSELMQALEEKRVLEVFGSGTAAIISAVDQFGFRGKRIDVPCNKELGMGELSKKFYDQIVDIQRGKIPSPWSEVL
jgi:branched-chain amino acid aminotransferase